MSQTAPEPFPEEPDSEGVPPTRPASTRDQPGWQTNVAKLTMGWQANTAKLTDRSQKVAVRWLYNRGSWFFGALTALSLILILDLILIGSGGPATLVAGLAVAIALPFNLAGLWLIRFFKDLKLTAGEAILKQPDESTVVVTPTKKGLIDSTATIAFAVGGFFTVVSVISALWRISWAVPVVFLLAAVLALLLASRVLNPTK